MRATSLALPVLLAPTLLPAEPPRLPSKPAERAAPPATPSLTVPPAASQPGPATAAPTAEPGPHGARTVTVSDDGVATIQLSATGLNRVLLPEPIASAHTQSDAIDLTLEDTTAIVTFRAKAHADILLITSSGQFLVRLVPADLPPQTVRIRQTRTEAQAAPSYQSQLASLIESAYRREPPRGYQTERVGQSLTVDGAVRWWLGLRHKGRVLTVEEYTLYNDGAVPHHIPLTAVAARFPTARALSIDPDLLPPGAWGRVLVVLDTDSAVAARGQQP